METQRQLTCEDRIDEVLNSRLDDLENFQSCGWDEHPDLGNFLDYGLSLEYCENDHGEGYIRWLLSWGGPSDEFRIYISPRNNVTKIVYHYMDWWDGAQREIPQHDYDAIHEACEFVVECCDIDNMVAQFVEDNT